MKILGYILIFIAAISCTGIQKKNKDLTNIYIASQASKYYLSPSPDWLNFASSARCIRNSQVQFLDLINLRDSFRIDYIEAIQMQLSVNDGFRKFRERFKKDDVSPQLRERIFFQAKDEVLSDIRIFKLPDFQRIHLVWIDPLLNGSGDLTKFKALFNSESFFDGHPVLVSACMTRPEMEKFVKNQKLSDIDIRLISAEMFSVVNDKFDLSFEYSLNIEKLLKSKKVIQYIINKKQTRAIKGKREFKYM